MQRFEHRSRQVKKRQDQNQPGYAAPCGGKRQQSTATLLLRCKQGMNCLVW